MERASTTPLLDVYRDGEPKDLCATCRDIAVLRCGHCGRTFCDRHSSINACCPDCELAYSNLEARATMGVLGSYAILSVSALPWIALAGSPFPLWVFGPLAGLLGVLLGVVTRRLTRRIWFGRAKGTELLEGVKIWILAHNSPEPEWRRGSGYPCRSRGETPTPDWGMRTYGR